MSKVISLTDLKLIDGLSHLNYFEMIHPSNDRLVHGYLKQLGFDIEEGILYTACQHRNMQGDVVLNYLVSGDMLLDRVSLTSPFSTYEDRLIAASIYDRSLFEQLHELGNTSSMYGGVDALDENIPKREQDSEYSEEEERITAQIKQLEELLHHIRGDQYRADGSVKRLEDYEHPEQPAEKKRKRNKKVKGIVSE